MASERVKYKELPELLLGVKWKAVHPNGDMRFGEMPNIFALEPNRMFIAQLSESEIEDLGFEFIEQGYDTELGGIYDKYRLGGITMVIDMVDYNAIIYNEDELPVFSGHIDFKIDLISLIRCLGTWIDQPNENLDGSN